MKVNCCFKLCEITGRNINQTKVKNRKKKEERREGKPVRLKKIKFNSMMLTEVVVMFENN